MGLVPDSENILVPPVGYLQQVDNIRSRQDSLISLDHNDSVLDIQGQSKSERTGPRAKSSVQSSLTCRKFFYHVSQAIKTTVIANFRSIENNHLELPVLEWYKTIHLPNPWPTFKWRSASPTRSLPDC